MLAWWGVGDEKDGLIVAMAVLTLVPFIVRALQRQWDPFEPIHIAAIAILVMMVGRPIVELNQHLAPYAPLYNARLGFDPAMVVGLVGTAAFYAGYFCRFGAGLAQRIRPLPSDWDADRSMRFVIGLLILGALLEAVYIRTVGLQTFFTTYSGRTQGNFLTAQAAAGYFSAGVYLAIPGALITYAAWRKRRSIGTAALLALCIGVSVLITVPRGDRTYILALSLPLVVLWYLARGRRPRVLSLLVAFLVFLVVANVFTTLRDTQTRQQVGVEPAIVHAITNPGHAVSSFLTGSDPSEFSVMEIQMHAYRTDGLHFFPGSTLSSLLTGWIPRTLWPNKPISTLQHVGWWLFPPALGNFHTPMFGSFYGDYGWLTLIVLSLAVGIGLRALWEYYRRDPGSTGRQIVFAAALPLVVILLRSDLSLTFAGAVVLILPLIFCVLRCSRPPLQLRAWRRRLTRLLA